MVFSIGEADRELAAYCIENKCFGVLGFDSDFFLFDLPRYLSSDSLIITEDEFSVISYEKDKVLQALGLASATELILVGCLVGNDFMEMKTLIPFHEYMLGEGLTGWDMRWRLIVGISNLIAGIRQSLILSGLKTVGTPNHVAQEGIDPNLIIQQLPVVKDIPSLAEAIRNAMKQYHFHSSAELAQNLLTKRNLDSLPEAVSKRFQQGLVIPGLMTILYRRSYMKGAILGNPYRLHALLSTKALRLATYHIVFGKGTKLAFLPPPAGAPLPLSSSSVPHKDIFHFVTERLGVNPFTLKNPTTVPVPLDPELPNFLDLWTMNTDMQFEAMLKALKVSPASPIWGFWLRHKRVDSLYLQYTAIPDWVKTGSSQTPLSEYKGKELEALFPGLKKVPESERLFNEPVPLSQVRSVHQKALWTTQRLNSSGNGRGRGRNEQASVRQLEQLMASPGKAPLLPDPELTALAPHLDVLILITLTLGYLWTHKLIDRSELIALLYQALICGSKNEFALPEGEEGRRGFITLDGLHIGSLFLKAAEDILLLNNTCGNPLKIEGPWCYFDGVLMQYFLNCIREVTPKPPFMIDGEDNKTAPEARIIAENEKLTDKASEVMKTQFPDLADLANILKPGIAFYTVLSDRTKPKTAEEERLEIIEVDHRNRLTFAGHLQNEEFQKQAILFWKKASIAAGKAEKARPPKSKAVRLSSN